MIKTCGFTLVEMLAATAIAAILMVALLKVTASLGRLQAAMTAPPQPARSSLSAGTDAPVLSPPWARDRHRKVAGATFSQRSAWRSDLLGVLKRDLQTARRVSMDNHQLVIEGLSDIGGRRKNLTHQPVIVRYVWVHHDDLNALVRRQALMLATGGGGGGGRSIDLLAAGIKSFTVTLLYASSKGLTTSAPSPTNDGGRPLPAAVSIQLTFQNKARPPLKTVIPLEE